MSNKLLWMITVLSLFFFVSGGFFFLQTAKTPQRKSVQGISVPSGTLVMASVIDGDTGVLSDGRHVRFLGINSSEKGESYHDEAMNLLKKLVEGKQVRLEFDQEQKDRYGRTLAYVFTGDVFANEQMVLQGMAITDFMQKNMTYESELTTAEKDAQKNCRGMWQGLCTQEAQCIKIVGVQTTGSTRNDEWIQIENTCTKQMALKGFMLKDTSSSNRFTFPDVTLSYQAIITLHSGCGKNANTDFYWACPQAAYPIWNNDHDSAFLYDTQGLLVGYYRY